MTEETAIVEKKWTQNEIKLIRDTCAPKCTEEEFNLLLYQARTYKLDPLLKQIWAVKYQQDKPASIFVGRDGYLAIAHQSGKLQGMESGTRIEKDDTVGFARVWRSDMAHPFCVEVSLKEYNKQQNNWKTMPRTMIQKVAESQALRRAFNISGVYSPEEMEEPVPERGEPKEIPLEPIIDADQPVQKGRMKRAPVDIVK